MQPCPSGLTCNADKLCVNGPGQTCDDSGDGGPPPDGTICSGWEFAISNISRCLALPTTDWQVSGAITVTASRSPVVPGATEVEVIDGYVVIRAKNVTISSMVTIESGNDGEMLPVIIAASETVTIDGVVEGMPARFVHSHCSTMAAGLGEDSGACTMGSGGGGGGGFGEIGARGGNCGDGALAGSGGGDSGSIYLVPLRGGCPGGHGAGLLPMPGGLGGAGGGAIQISARDLHISSTGVIDMSGGPGGTTAARPEGGGGGGAGGAILLEAINGSINGKLCANGGSGGGEDVAGARGQCTYGPAIGATDPDGGKRGGDGGFGIPTGSVVDAKPGVSQLSYGGGGGGGVGRIHISNNITPSGAIITPPAR